MLFSDHMVSKMLLICAHVLRVHMLERCSAHVFFASLLSQCSVVHDHMFPLEYYPPASPHAMDWCLTPCSQLLAVLENVAYHLGSGFPGSAAQGLEVFLFSYMSLKVRCFCQIMLD